MSTKDTWIAPGAGQWAVDRSHMPAGCTPIMQHIVTTAMPAGMRRMFRDLGAPIETLSCEFVNGQMYTRLRPLISPDKPAKKLPPAFVLKVATRLHPEMRRRNRTAGEVREGEPWNEVIARWHRSDKQLIVDQNLALQGVDRSELDDAALVAHVQATLDHAIAKMEHHFWLHGYDLGPLGQYMFEASQWGIDPKDLLALLEGASPSTSAPRKAALAIREAVERAGAQPGTLDELRAVSPEIGAAVDEYLAHRSAVLFSRYDIDGITLGERPDLVLASIMNATDLDTSAEVTARTVAVRAQVPAEHRARFDRILSQARAAMDLRDDNGPTTAEWPVGVVRLALQELGRRAVARGVWSDPSLVFELRADEISAAVLDGRPDEATLRGRADARRHQRQLDPPRLLGPAELAPPPEVLPEHLRHLVGMVQAVMTHMGMDGATSGNGLQGSGIGTTPMRGRARVATSPEEALDRLEPGDVLVVAGTTPAYNLVLSLAGGVITAEGGPMSHAAVIARELGIPAIVGVRAALTDIPDGALVEIDPVKGEVRIIAVDAASEAATVGAG
jgi:rifampicin phosphotransferase